MAAAVPHELFVPHTDVYSDVVLLRVGILPWYDTRGLESHEREEEHECIVCTRVHVHRNTYDERRRSS